jgi:hypothetical protein
MPRARSGRLGDVAALDANDCGYRTRKSFRSSVKSTHPCSTNVNGAVFSFHLLGAQYPPRNEEGNVMNDVANCRAMELLCRERATADPSHSWKWLGQAQRWRELEARETAWQFQRRSRQQQMHAGPMAMGPNPVGRDLRNKQQG